ncbi:MAG TPA: glycosyl hydrolase family 79 C-terminal domain-containing protein [Solirubrobacteraceae bacterium]
MIGRRQLVAATAVACLALTVAACGGGDETTANDARPPTPALGPVPRKGPLPEATVTVAARGPSIPVPRSYFGISTEYWGIDHFGRFMGDYERLMSMLRVPGNGPFVLRIGGDSADHSLLDVTHRRLPASIFDVTPPWFHRVSELVDTLHARLIFDLGLVAAPPVTAVRWAHAAMTELPRGSLLDYEIGNEPDLYTRRYWATVFSPLGLLVRDLPVEVTPSSYVKLFGAYSTVLGRISPRVGLAGPVVAYPALALAWISTLLESHQARLRLVTAHEYPYSACAPPLSAQFPTIGRILSERASAGMAAAVKPAVLLAHRAGFPFRLTELNSVTCGGSPGVSNTFATALWAPDALFELMRTGANGVNVHVRAYAVNGAWGLGRDGLVTHPLYYGLLLLTRMLGPGARLVTAHLAAPPSLHLKAWAVRVGKSELRALVINKGRHAVHAILRLPARAPATVDRLLAPSPRATTGERLNGQYLGAHQRWVGSRSNETIRPAADGYELDVPAASAALVRVQTEPQAR